MKLFGSIKELVAAVFRKDSQQITLRPNQTTSYTADRDVQLPPQNADAVIVSESASQTLTNKTMGSTNTLTGATAASLTNSGAVTLPSGVDTLIGRVSADQTANRLKNKDLDDASVVIVDTSDTTKKIKFDAGGTTATFTTIVGAQTANRSVTLPDATDTLAGISATQALTNKTIGTTNTVTLTDTAFTLQDDGDATKQVQFNIGSISAGTTKTLTLPDTNSALLSRSSADQLANNVQNKDLNSVSVKFVDNGDTSKQLKLDLSGATGSTATTLTASQTSNRVVTLPNATTTLVGTDVSQTLSNKTLGSTNTLTGATAGSFTNTGTITLPTATTTLVGTGTSDTLSNKTLASPIITTAETLNAQAETRYADADSSNYVGFKAPATVTANAIWTLPAADGSANQILQTDGSKTLSFASVASASLNQYNTDIGNSSNSRTATDTSLLGDAQAISSSFTFATTDVNTTTDVITKTAHGLVSGDRVYLTSSGGLPAGLTASTTYYVIRLTSSTFQLATSFINAFTNVADGTTTNPVAIDLTTTGTGTHSLFYGGLIDNSPRYIEASITSLQTFSANATYFDVCSIIIGKGEWVFAGGWEITRNSVTFTSTEFIIAITGTTGNSATGIVIGANGLDYDAVAPVTFSRFPTRVDSVRALNDGTNLTIAGTTTACDANGFATVYLKGYAASFTGTAKYKGTLSCRKISV